MIFARLLFTAGLIAQASARNFVFAVGKTNLTFEPSTITGAVKGDTLEFRFYARNHSVVQGDLDTRRTPPCTPPQEGIFTSGFFSGFNFPTPPGSVNNKTFVVTLNSSAPIVVYCSQNTGSHCKNGMVAVINGAFPAAASRYLSDYQFAAANSNGTAVSPASVFGGEILPLNASSTTTTSSSAGTTSTATVTRTTSPSSSASTTSTSTASTTSASSTSTAAAANSFGASFIGLAVAGAAAVILV